MEGRRNSRLAPRPRREGDLVRLFFALWPDPATRVALEALSCALHEQCGGRRVDACKVHLTLVFLGDVPGDLVPALQRMAGTVRSAAIDLTLNIAEYWRHNRIVWVGTTHCPQTLHELHARLGEVVSGLGLRTEARDYAPHITLLRQAERGPVRRQFSDIVWHAPQFALVRSLTQRNAVGYEVIATWPLDACARSS